MPATRESATFRLRYHVATDISARPDVVWARLTDAEAFPSWNRTVEAIEGPIALGQRLAIKVPVAPGRVFRPKVVTFEPDTRMVWQDGFAPMFQGTRTFTLTPDSDGATRFEMEETFTGLMLPMIAGSLPDFTPIFDHYAADLKAVCEAR